MRLPIILFFTVLFLKIHLISVVALFPAEKSSCNIIACHPVHISYTNVEYIPEKEKFEILFKIFVDDFDLILSAKYGKNLNLKEGQWENSYEEIIKKYIEEHFSIKNGDKNLINKSFRFVSKEIKEGAIWLYFDVKSKEKKSIFDVRNTLLMDLYQDQNNLLIFSYKGSQKAFKFNYSTMNEVFTF